MIKQLPFIFWIIFGWITIGLLYLVGATTYLIILFFESLKTIIHSNELWIYYLLIIFMILTLVIMVFIWIIMRQIGLQHQWQQYLEALFLFEIFVSGLYAIMVGAFLILIPNLYPEIYIINGLGIAMALFLFINFIYLNYAMDNFAEN